MKLKLALLFSLLSGLCFLQPAPCHAVQLVDGVDKQPLVAATKRMMVALEAAGSPLSVEATAALEKAFRKPGAESVAGIQKVLDPLCLAHVEINAESRVKVRVGECKKELMQNGWRAFLVKVHNMARINPLLVVESPNAAPVYQQGKWPRERPRSDEKLVDQDEVLDRFLTISMLDRPPLQRKLSGLELEYRVLLLYSRDAGQREASLSFHIGAGTKDIGFRSAMPVLFDCQRAVEVKLNVRDFDNKPTTASFVIVDEQGRVYPHQSRRLAPDFFFHRQVYRSDGESVWLPPGKYSFTVSRGPEYLPLEFKETIADAKSHELSIRLERWTHLAKRNWFSGDHHIHAAGCSHYDSPTEGVGPEAMMRHVRGEDLNIGNVLSWGPCWYTQKQYFNGDVSKLSTPENILRYDVEVSGFPSSHCGHLCLLKLAEDDYPDAENLEDWPSWTLPVLKWGKEQGGIVGYSHSGWGIATPDIMPDGSRGFPEARWGGAPDDWRGKPSELLPDYAMPRFDGIGANEYVVTAAHNVCDFISAVDTPAFWELNIWYHTLNCGMTTRISGETDFPCIYDDKVGLGRVYVKFPDDTPLNYNTWVEGLRDGRSYVSDGLSHIVDFKINGLGVGEKVNDSSANSRIDLKEPSTVKLSFDATAMLPQWTTEETEAIRERRLDEKPYWHIERCRIGLTRTVPVEIVVNGEVVKTEMLVADGKFNTFETELKIEKSSWVAVRILPSSHTNPIFVHVDGQPIRANSKSAQWCIDAVGVCWDAKKHQIRESEQEAAKKAYDQAADVYRKILSECVGD
ncbi:CehA/McbA family metallohydrolase [Mariniblastus fucicola]|uniref:CehA/McbA family metallohydrolase n=1 Tax=Mariniblastus fucicola TaxID=980251 RepID=A0A5B9P7R4_9BACT|nr:CehA/McbA family metallohydrolase [Mariniblastus fucicola]QEG21549.1 hypothetical protein MFFC18_14060 [Mariniblastus fucicola]